MSIYLRFGSHLPDWLVSKVVMARLSITTLGAVWAFFTGLHAALVLLMLCCMLSWCDWPVKIVNIMLYPKRRWLHVWRPVFNYLITWAIIYFNSILFLTYIGKFIRWIKITKEKLPNWKIKSWMKALVLEIKKQILNVAWKNQDLMCVCTWYVL